MKKLTGLRRLIFLDRYAKKGRPENIKVGDTVVVITREDPRWPAKEVGVVQEIKGDRAIVKLEESEELFEQDLLKLDLPLETDPSHMWDRMTEAIMEVEDNQNPDYDDLKEKFRWLLDGFRFSPGGRINAMLGANRGLTAYNCFQGDTIVITEDGPKKIKDLQGEVRVYSRNGVIRSAYFRKYGVDRLWRIELENGQVFYATGNHRWPVLIDGGRETIVTTEELLGKRLIQVRVGRDYFDDDEVREGRPTVKVVSVEPTSRVEEVYCCEEPETHTFVIEGGILTGNCFVLPSPKDSRGGIMEILRRQAETMAVGGGVGINLSTLRPRYSYVRKVNGRSSGAVSWADLFSELTNKIEQGGSRRGALMLILNDFHPDIEEFIEAKKDPLLLNYCNVSVGISDDFMAAVKEDRDWQLKFPDYEAVPDDVYEAEWNGNIKTWEAKGYPVKVYKTVKARDIWNKIIESAWASAEPGVVFLERCNKESNSYYFNELCCTNPCGEQPLPADAVCNLGHINLSRFVEGPIGKGKVKWDELAKAVKLGVRFLDNIINYTMYHDPQIEANQKSERRVGMGTLGLGEMLIRLGYRYGSKESLKFIDKLYKFIAVHAYEASIELAAEKGAFPKFDYEKYIQSGFMKRMLPNLSEKHQRMLKETGIRNVTLLTQAPTGSTGTMIGTSTGIEPYFQWEYIRRGRLGEKVVREMIVDEWLTETKNQGKTVDDLPDYFVTAMELTPEEHVRVQAAIQKWVDSAISKTANAPSTYTVEDTRKLYELAYSLGLKGCTIYVDKSRNEQVLNLIEDEGENKEAEQPGSQLEQADKGYVVRRGSIVRGTTERIQTAVGKIYVTVNCNEDDIPVEVIINAGKAGTEVQAWAEFAGRLISTALKYGAPLEALIKQGRHITGSKPFFYRADIDEKGTLLKSGPDAVAFAMSRHLNETTHKLKIDSTGIYATNVTVTLHDIVGDTCEACGSKNVFRDAGCLSCKDCGYSGCS